MSMVNLILRFSSFNIEIVNEKTKILKYVESFLWAIIRYLFFWLFFSVPDSLEKSRQKIKFYILFPEYNKGMFKLNWMHFLIDRILMNSVFIGLFGAGSQDQKY